MLDSEMEAVQIPGYKQVDKMGTSRHRGGILAIASPTIACRKLEGIEKPSHPIDACSFILYPTESEDYQLRITGVYLPPSCEPQASQLECLVDQQYQTQDPRGGCISHLLIGDFNPN